MRKHIITFFVLGALLASGFTFSIKENTIKVSAADVLQAPSQTYINNDAATYYAEIDDSLEGNALLSALQDLNKTKRQHTTGYNAILYTSGKYTDYDVNHVQYDSKGQPYSDYITGFYSGTVALKASGMNREHVWPQSHGGKKIENDIHMPRPAIESENGSRGNSFYVEGKCHSSNGWDPAMESFGDETYRGDSARIIFYCLVGYSGYSLIDEDSHTTSNSNPDFMMGKLSDLLKWNLNYAVQQREMNRNEGAEYLQGNRNPFIDHPEYACRIWGKYNAETQRICSSGTPTVLKNVVIKENNKQVNEITLESEESKTFEGYVDNEFNSKITWSLLKANKVDAYDGDTKLEIANGKATVTASDKKETLYLKASYTYDDEGTSRTISSYVKLTTRGSGSSTPSGESFSITYTVTGKTNITIDGDEPTGSSASYSQTYSTAGQITGGKNAILALSGYEGNSISGIKLKMHSNGKSGAGSFKATIGDDEIASTSGEFNKWYGNDSYGTDWREIEVTNIDSTRVVGDNEDIVLNITASTNSLYINSFTITFNQDSETPPEPPYEEDVVSSISVDLSKTKTEYEVGDTFTKPVVTLTYESGKTEQAEESYISCSGFDTNEVGSQVITVTYSKNECTKTTTYNVTVKEKPVDPPVDPEDPPVDPGDPPVDPVDPPVNPETPKTNNGCGGNVMVTSVVLSSLALMGIILIIITKVVRRKKTN